jgi:transposase InsO family protein
LRAASVADYAVGLAALPDATPPMGSGNTLTWPLACQFVHPVEVFGTARSLSKKGCPFDNAVDESTNKSLKAEMVWGEEFGDLHELQTKLSDYVWWYNNERLHSTLNYMSPVEFRLAGLSL